MAPGLLEAAIFFQGMNLVEDTYYLHDYDKVFDESQKKTLIEAITNLATSAFGDNIQNFAMGDHVVFLTSSKVEVPNKERGNTESLPIIMYCIAEKDTNKKLLTESMKTGLFQFVNRFTSFDIISKNVEKFKEFKERFEKIFKGLIKTEEKEDYLNHNKKVIKNQGHRGGYGSSYGSTSSFQGRY
ncbi:hypothetical protein DSAG12_01319 [Promethearchaeum syntrophicum]|uniref:Uncharacterized protein n=1 Tax=Promethearchaeum syntrophicum TaxID=2594042 RepID=A0A5B9D8V0_9ARCH|nr:hypothetical protein DSAG12_01319 [Candidatus Prometheoarchaeum syntrophicum]